jgi:hypothetical protein
MPAPRLAKLDFQEKLIQSGKKENTEAVLKRIKVSTSTKPEEGNCGIGIDEIDITSEIGCFRTGYYRYQFFETCL